MFESALIEKLAGDSVLAALVTDYSSNPAIFSEFAPENALLPYIVVRITRSSSESPALQEFSVYVDYFDYEKSAANSRAAAERIEFLLDRAELDSTRYGCIRMFFFSGGSVQESDPRSIHYNLQFSAKAGRKKWAEYVSTTEEV